MLSSILLTTNAFSLEPARFVKNPDAGQPSVRHEADFDSAEAVSKACRLGIGLELDTSKYHIIVTRARGVLRFMRGDNVEGYGLGLAVSF